MTQDTGAAGASGAAAATGAVAATGAAVAHSNASVNSQNTGPVRTTSRGGVSRTHSRAASLSMGPIDEGLTDGDPFKSAADNNEPSPDTHGLNMKTHARRPSTYSNFSMTGDSPPVSPALPQGDISANF